MNHKYGRRKRIKEVSKKSEGKERKIGRMGDDEEREINWERK